VTTIVRDVASSRIVDDATGDVTVMFGAIESLRIVIVFDSVVACAGRLSSTVASRRSVVPDAVVGGTSTTNTASMTDFVFGVETIGVAATPSSVLRNVSFVIAASSGAFAGTVMLRAIVVVSSGAVGYASGAIAPAGANVAATETMPAFDFALYVVAMFVPRITSPPLAGIDEKVKVGTSFG